MSELTDETGDLSEARPDLYRDIGYGLVERDVENTWLAAGAEPGPLDDLIGHSTTYRIAVSPRAGVSVSGTTAVADGAGRFAGQGRSTVGSRSPSGRLREHGSVGTGGLKFIWTPPDRKVDFGGMVKRLRLQFYIRPLMQTEACRP